MDDYVHTDEDYYHDAPDGDAGAYPLEEEWDEVPPASFIFHSSEELDAAEQALGFLLPAVLRDAYLHGRFPPKDYPEEGAYAIGEAVNFYRSAIVSNADFPHLVWPRGMLPIYYWGCTIWSCVDCTQPEAPIFLYDACESTDERGEPCGHVFHLEAESFRKWMV